MTGPHVVTGRCGACTRSARRYPSGRWEHDGRPCAMRSQTLFTVFDFAPSRAMLVFVPDGEELPQPRGRRAEDLARLEQRHPDIDWRAHFAQPSEWDRVREQLRAEAEQPRLDEAEAAP